MTIEKDAKTADRSKFEDFIKELGSGDSTSFKVATFLNDYVIGTFAEEFMKFIKENQKIKLVDAYPFFEKVESIKCPSEQV